MCGVFGYIIKEWNDELANYFALMGFYLQHRGQANSGAALSNGDYIEDIIKKRGLVSQIFTPEYLEAFRKFRPLIATGHTRYATAGSESTRCAQPQWVDSLRGRRVVVSNGDLPCLSEERRALEEKSIVLLSGRNRQGEAVTPNDAEIILKKICFLAEYGGGDYVEALRRFMTSTAGAYSTAFMLKDRLFLFRDPYGFRPLLYGRWRGATIFASESRAFHGPDARVEGEVKPGELIVFGLVFIKKSIRTDLESVLL